jgi:glucosamine-phosphate N-acetyltransferase
MIVIREINESDVQNGFLEVLDNLVSPNITEEHAIKILNKIKINKLHKIFVAINTSNNQVIGCITLLIEFKFINKGMKVGYVEDVAVRRGYERKGIGIKLVNEVTKFGTCRAKCKKIILYCNKSNIPFYKKLGFKVDEGAVVMKFESK